MRLKPKKEELPSLSLIIVTAIGILYSLFTLSLEIAFILIGIEALLWMALSRDSTISRIEAFLKKEKFFIYREKLLPLPERLEKAKKSIWIVSQTFTILIGTYSHLLEKKYKEGCDIRILLLNPKKIKSKMMSNLDKDVLKDQLNSSIKIIKKYKERSEKNGVINGRLLPFEAGFGLFIIDGKEPEGQIKVELILKNTGPAEWPNVMITRKEGKIYNHLMKHFSALWELSDPIT